jgi:peptide/nickel transport system permease protein
MSTETTIAAAPPPTMPGGAGPHGRLRDIATAAGRRLGLGVITLWGAVTLVFVLEHLSGDPAELLTPPTAPPSERAQIARQLGLDHPFFAQYWHYLTQVVQGNFGTSFSFHQSAASLVLGRAPATLELAAAAMVIAVAAGVPLGLLAAFRNDRPGARVLSSGMVLGQAVPPFLIAPLLIAYVGVRWHLTPVSGRAGFTSLILPAVSLSLFQVSVLFRITRGAALKALSDNYVEFARAKGARKLRLAWQHVLPNTLLPLMTVAALALATLIGGSVIVETIFNWPGIGYLLIQAVQIRDFPIVSAVTVIFATAYIVLNMIVDILYAVVDPRSAGAPQ